jgi:hypothetical protein
MIALIWFVLAVLASPFKSKSRLEAENAVLRHQLIVLQRRGRGRAQATNNDRWFLVQMYRWFPSILTVVTIVRPETLVSWHRAGFRRYLALEIAASQPTRRRSGSHASRCATSSGRPHLVVEICSVAAAGTVQPAWIFLVSGVWLQTFGPRKLVLSFARLTLMASFNPAMTWEVAHVRAENPRSV